MAPTATDPFVAHLHELIRSAEERCRESEFLRRRAEQAMRRTPFFPDRRTPHRRQADALTGFDDDDAA